MEMLIDNLFDRDFWLIVWVVVGLFVVGCAVSAVMLAASGNLHF